ncbi:MAG: hypothetical protein ACXWEO_02770 [Methylobacter sp.]
MSVVVEIQGRGALPVWVVPYVTSWRLSPDMLLERLAGHNSVFPTAFNLSINNKPSLLPPAQWNELYKLVQKIERDLTAKNLPESDDRKEWLKCSIEQFWRDESSYVWLDEFEEWYYQKFMKNYYVYDEGENIELCLNPKLPKEHAEHFEKTELRPLDTKAPLNKLDKELQDARIIENGAPTISLWSFIGRLLVEATGDSLTLPTFYRLVEEGGLVIYDCVLSKKHEYIQHKAYNIKPEIVSQDELLGALRQREQLADKLFDHDSFQFWETLVKESRYSLCRDNVAMAYRRVGKLQFPWFSLDDTLVWLNTEEYINADFLEKWQQQFGRPYEGAAEHDEEFNWHFEKQAKIADHERKIKECQFDARIDALARDKAIETEQAKIDAIKGEIAAYRVEPKQTEAERNDDASGKSNKPDGEKEFNLKLAALAKWMDSKGLKPDSDKPIKLKHYPEFNDLTKLKLYAELSGFDNAFLIAESTFYDFWQEQQLLKFK